MSKLPIIRLRPREGRRVRAGAPWVFSNEIVMDGAAKALAAGSAVTLADDKGAPMGVGYFNPKSLIAVRLLAGNGKDLGRDFLVERLARARDLRERLFDAPYYRLVHAEGDGLPGLVIDRFGGACVVQVTTAGMERMLDNLLAALDSVVAPETVVLRNDAPARSLEGLETYVRMAKGEMAARLRVEENAAHYVADLKAGQKSGWYYDQRDNRAFMAKLAPGKRVLDAYCYSGGFGVLAAVHGAEHVTGIDSSEAALKLAAEAAAANAVQSQCSFTKAEVFNEFERMAAMGEKFDIVICDPPPFAPSKKDVETGARAYRKLARMAAALVAPNGFLMLASCSHNVSEERFAAECAAGLGRASRSAKLIRRSGAGTDHPAHPMLPETAYLKALLYAVD
jgi:23S rRNA (cytosine1962-C5)-methyltransferase